MRPPSASTGSSFWVRKNGPLSWMFTRVSNCSSVVSAQLAWMPMPALFTRKSKVSRPKSRCRVSPTWAAKAPKPELSLTSRRSMRARPPRRSTSRATAWASSAWLVGADDVDALGRQVQRRVLAKATAGAGDECDLASHGVLLDGLEVEPAYCPTEY